MLYLISRPIRMHVFRFVDHPLVVDHPTERIAKRRVWVLMKSRDLLFKFLGGPKIVGVHDGNELPAAEFERLLLCPVSTQIGVIDMNRHSWVLLCESPCNRDAAVLASVIYEHNFPIFESLRANAV